MQASLLEIIELMLALPLVGILGYFIKNRKRAEDIINKNFRRGSCVKDRFITVGGNVLYKYRVPNAHGFMKINNGMYHFIKEKAVWDPHDKMWEISHIENQIEPVSGEIVMSEKETLVKVIDENGKKTEQKKKVPTGIVDYTGLKATMVRLVPTFDPATGEMIEQEESYTAQALAEYSNDHVTTDIVTSASQRLEQIKNTFIAVCVCLGLLVIVGYLVYDGFKRLDARIDGLMHLQNTASVIKNG